jgi:acyl-CoA dehydrogenase
MPCGAAPESGATPPSNHIKEEHSVQVNRTVYREDHEMLRETAKRFFERECVPRQAEWDKAGRVDRESWLKAGREGLLCVTIPSEYGGGGGDFGHAAVIIEETHRAGLSGVGFSLHSDIIAPYIVRLGSEAQKRKWLPGICAGETILAVGMTEPGGGSDVKAIRTTAVRDGDEYVINGSKTFISNGINCDMVMLVCKTDPAAGAKGVSLIMVETDRAGFRRGRKLDKVGQPAADTAELFFDNVRVPAGNLLGEKNQGFIYLMQELAQERLIIAVYSAAKVERLLEQTLEYVKERKAFGQTVWDFQNTKFKLADVKAQAVAMRTLVDYYLGEHLRRKLSVQEAAIAKLFATETMWKCIDDMVQLHGGYGYMLEYPIARAFTDMRVSRVAGGASEVLRDLIARKL